MSIAFLRLRKIEQRCAVMFFCIGSLTNAGAAGSEREPAARSTTAEPASQAQPTLDGFLQIDINRQSLDEAVLVLRLSDGGILLAQEDLERWRIKLPALPERHASGKAYYRLQTIAGATHQLDEKTQKLFIELPPSAFQNLSLDSARPATPRPGKTSLGMFFNYDLLAEHAALKTHIAGLVEIGTFNAYGVGVANFIGSHEGTSNYAIRLDTVWTFDDQAKRASWQVGDTITRAASEWGMPVRFGGIRYSSNFSLQPGFISMKQQNVAGEVGLPSTVDVFVNNALVSRNDVPPGPFSVSNIPSITGQGVVLVVVRDLLGREQVTTQPFYASARLLQRGLADFSYEIGRERKHFSTVSNDYGRSLAAGTYRRGISDTFTAETHAEAVSGNQQTAGLNGTWSFASEGAAGIINAAVAASRSLKGSGELGALGFEVQHGNVSASGRAQGATATFTQIGLSQGQLAPRRLVNLSVGYSGSKYGSFGASYVLQDKRDTERAALVSLSYSTNLGKWGYLGVTLLKALDKTSSNSASAFVSIPLDSRTSSSFDTQRKQDGKTELNAQVQQSLLASESVGYRLSGSRNGAQRAEGSYSNDVGTYSVAAAHQSAETAFRANIAGGVALIESAAFFSRRIVDSFALVQVPDYADVRIYADNQLVGRTDKNGNALLTRVRPYEINSIKINSTDLPLDVKVDALALKVVPAYRSGVVVKFPVSRSRGATLKIRLADGTALPTGAQVSVDQQPEEFPVVNNGEVYVSGLTEHSVLQVNWQGHRCQIPLTYPASTDPLPFLGSFVCTEVFR